MKTGKSALVYGVLMLLMLLARPAFGVQTVEAGGLEEAIAWGLAHSPSLLNLRYEVEQVQRQLAQIETGLRWQLSLDGGLNLTGREDATGPVPSREGADQVRAGITGRKAFRSGLSLEPQLTLKKDLNAAEEAEFGFTFSVNQRLYPWVPSPLEQEYYRTLNMLKKAEANLTWQATRLKIDWLEGYLNLIRLAEQLAIAETEYAIAADELDLTQERAAIGEAGRIQILTAQAALKQAEYQRKQAANRFEEVKRQWLLALGLPFDHPVTVLEDNSYLQQLREEVDLLSVTPADAEALWARLEATHHQLAAKRLDRSQLEQDWQWKQGEYQPQVSSGGTYDPSSQSWTLNLNLNYQLWDGGARRLERERYEAQLAVVDREEQNLRTQLDAELRSLLNEVVLAELQMEAKDLALAKVNLETEVYRQQWEAGFLTAKDWTLKQLEQKSAELSVKAAADELFLCKLRVFHLVGML